MHNTCHTLEARLKMSKNCVPTNYKDGRANYSSVHKWIVRWFGKADKCESIDCLGKSKTFDWANITGIYEKNTVHFKKLCRSCHTKLDGHCFQTGHAYLRVTR